MVEKIVTAKGSSNIAFVKHWGKSSRATNKPESSSISATLDMVSADGEPFCTTTSVLFSDRLASDSLFINGEAQDFASKETQERFRVVDVLRKEAGIKTPVLVVSKNSFPTASGLASSASGVATLVYASAKALGLEMSPKELSMVARQGSGSAARSVFGGYVVWWKGTKPDGSDSYSEQLFDAKHWPDLVDVIAVASSNRKEVSSTEGMGLSAEQGEGLMYKKRSILYGERIRYTDAAVAEVTEALRARNFDRLAEAIMRESNNLQGRHA